ncbi:hypothetical protein ANO11243_074170 [Dothideomycetidae sp. 11243]|nr:hypothetical protein ANO11243_074170 [fungal sp. No.11243]
MNAEQSLVQLLQRKEWDDYGFVMFRMAYNDEARWEQFSARFDEILDGRLDNGDQDGGLEKIKDKMLTRIVDDDLINDSGVFGAAGGFQLCRARDPVEPGLDLMMCLMADAECIASVLEPEDGIQPFVKAVDVRMTEADYVSKQEPGYEGCFKVAIQALPVEFYLALHTVRHPSELVRDANPVWQSMQRNTG